MPISSNNSDYTGSLFDLPFDSLILPPITEEDLLKTLQSIKPSVSINDLQK